MDKKTEALKLALEALLANDLLVNGDDKKGGLAWCMDGYFAGCFDIEAVNKQTNDAITAIREALAEQPAQQQEPVVFKPFEIETSIEEGGEIHQTVTDLAGNVMLHVLDTQENDVRSALIEMGWTPPQPASKPWVGLTRDEIIDIINRFAGEDWVYAVDAIEAKLKEKNA